MNDFSPAIDAELPEADFSIPTPAEIASVSDADAPAGPNGFELLGLAPELLQAVADLGFTEPTAVQNATIPFALSPSQRSGATGSGYADLMVSSQTGSGKTAAFLLPVLHTLLAMQAEEARAEKEAFDKACAEAAAKGEAAPKRPRRKNPTDPRNFKPAVPGALVVCPTRELAQQVANDAIDLVRHARGLRIANVVGGMPYQMQVAKLQNANLVVATPGRLLDLERAGQIKLNEVRFLVMDEADRMLDLGFADDLAEINRLTAQRQQTMMFSATFAPRIQQLAMRVMHDNGAHVKKVEIASPQEKHVNITQSLYWADTPQHKRALLDHWLRDTTINQAIVFACTQIECDELAVDLQQVGFSAVALHGALSQGMRNRRLSALRDGRVQILVATDVAARGIDVPTITHVFNFGLPMKAEDYTHRIGRTGRAGRDGLAITFAEFRDRRRIADIEHHTQQPLKTATVEGLEPKGRFPSSFFGQGDGRRGAPAGRGAPRGGFDRGGRGEGRGEGRSEGRGAPRGEFRSEPRADFRHDVRGDGRGVGHGPAHHHERGAARPGGFAGFGRADKAPHQGWRSGGDHAAQGDRRPGGARPEGRAEGRFEGRGEGRPSGPRFEGRAEGRADGRGFGGAGFDARSAEHRPRKPAGERSGFEAPRRRAPARG
jgi:superfamily II DNA/RNA helicase